MGGKKKLMVLFGGLGVLSFAASIAVSIFFGAAPPPPAPGGAGQADAQGSPQLAHLAAAVATMKPNEKQLEDLIKEMRYKLAEYRRKEQQLAEREERIRIAQEVLTKQAKDLENLRVEVASLLPRLKEQQQQLTQGRVLITREEAANVGKLAPVFEKMTPEEGSKILERLARNKQEDYVVMLLVSMTERASAKLLEAMDDTLAASLCEKVKKIRQEK